MLQFGGDYIRDIIDNVLPKVEGYDATVVYLRSITNRCNFENEDKHIKAQLILGTHSQNYANSALLIRQYLSNDLLVEENYLRKLTNKRVLLKTAKSIH